MADADLEGTFTVDWWIAVENYLTRQSVIDGDLSMAAEGQAMTMSMIATVTLADFSEPVTIEPPA